MKKALALAAAAVLIVAAWWMFGGAPPRKGPVALSIPENSKDTPTLIQSAHQLWQARAGHFNGSQLVQYLRLLATDVDDPSWKSISSAVHYAWSNHRGQKELAAAMVSLNEVLLPKFIRAGNLEELIPLVRAASTSGFDLKQINAALDQAMAAPLPPEGLAGSRQELILVACLRADEPKRASRYYEKLAWPQDAKSRSEWIPQAAELSIRAAAGSFAAPAVLALWRDMGSISLARAEARPVIEDLMSDEFKNRTERPGARPTIELFDATRALDDAEGFWRHVLIRAAHELHRKGPAYIPNYDRLLSAFVDAFKQDPFAYDIWMRTGDAQYWSRPENRMQPVAYYEKALRHAPTPAKKARSLKRVAEGYQKSKEFTKAREVVEKTLPAFGETEDVERKELTLLLEKLKKLESEDKDRVVKEVAAIDQDRKRGRLENMREQLRRARAENRPASTIQALEQAVKELERDVTE